MQTVLALSATQQASWIRNGKLSSVELVQFHLDHIGLAIADVEVAGAVCCQPAGTLNFFQLADGGRHAADDACRVHFANPGVGRVPYIKIAGGIHRDVAGLADEGIDCRTPIANWSQAIASSDQFDGGLTETERGMDENQCQQIKSGALKSHGFPC